MKVASQHPNVEIAISTIIFAETHFKTSTNANHVKNFNMLKNDFYTKFITIKQRINELSIKKV